MRGVGSRLAGRGAHRGRRTLEQQPCGHGHDDQGHRGGTEKGACPLVGQWRLADQPQQPLLHALSPTLQPKRPFIDTASSTGWSCGSPARGTRRVARATLAIAAPGETCEPCEVYRRPSGGGRARSTIGTIGHAVRSGACHSRAVRRAGAGRCADPPPPGHRRGRTDEVDDAEPADSDRTRTRPPLYLPGWVFTCPGAFYTCPGRKITGRETSGKGD